MNTIFAMGPYGFYVWSSAGLALAAYAWNVLAPALQRRALVEHLDDPHEQEEGA